MCSKNYLSTHRILRALFSRFICLCHIGFSIFVLYTVKNKELIYLVPLFGALFLLIETFLVIVFTKGREPTAWFSPAFFIYVCTIVSCYWLLELENIKKTLLGKRDKTVAVNYDTNGDIISFIKIIWSQLEIQIFFALILFVRWIIPKSNLSPQGLAELLVKYFAISCDMLDFLTILSDVTLVKNVEIVYATLSIWTWSTFQFFIYVPKYEDEEKKEFNAYISNSLLSVLFMDLPYLGLRVTTIFGLGSHNYNSYYFAVKNCLMILLQVVRIRAAFQERKIRSDKYASKLKDRHGTDKAPARLFDQNEMAKIKFANRFKNEENIPKTVLIELGVHDTQDVSLHLQKLSVDVDNQVEDLPQPPPHSINHTVSPYRHQPPVNMKIYSPVSNKGDDEDEQPPQPISKPLQSNSRTSLNPPKATTTRLPPTIKKANQVVTNAAVGMNLKNYTTNPMNRPANTNIRPAQTHTEI